MQNYKLNLWRLAQYPRKLTHHLCLCQRSRRAAQTGLFAPYSAHSSSLLSRLSFGVYRIGKLGITGRTEIHTSHDVIKHTVLKRSTPDICYTFWHFVICCICLLAPQVLLW